MGNVLVFYQAGLEQQAFHFSFFALQVGSLWVRQAFHCRSLHLSHLHSVVVLHECALPVYPVFSSLRGGCPRQAWAYQEGVK